LAIFDFYTGLILLYIGALEVCYDDDDP